MTFNLDEYKDWSTHGTSLGEYHVPWVDQSLYSPHQKSSIVCYYWQIIMDVKITAIHKITLDDLSQQLWPRYGTVEKSSVPATYMATFVTTHLSGNHAGLQRTWINKWDIGLSKLLILEFPIIMYTKHMKNTMTFLYLITDIEIINNHKQQNNIKGN